MPMSPVQQDSRLAVAHSSYAEDKFELCCAYNPGYISWQAFPIQKLFVAKEMPCEMCCLKLLFGTYCLTGATTHSNMWLPFRHYLGVFAKGLSDYQHLEARPMKGPMKGPMIVLCTVHNQCVPAPCFT